MIVGPSCSCSCSSPGADATAAAAGPDRGTRKHDPVADAAKNTRTPALPDGPMSSAVIAGPTIMPRLCIHPLTTFAAVRSVAETLTAGRTTACTGRGMVNGIAASVPAA